MTTPATASDDEDSETLDWLRMTSRILSGDIAPHEARDMLSAGAPKNAAPLGEPPLPARLP